MTVLLNYGSGALGSQTYLGDTSPINTYAKVKGIGADDTKIEFEFVTHGAAGALSIGDEVLLHVSGGIDEYTGNYDFYKITYISGQTLYLDRPCTPVIPHGKLAGHVVQLVKTAEYQDLVVNNGVTLSPIPYNGAVGGILAIRVKGTFTLNGRINASKVGYRYGDAQVNGGKAPIGTRDNYAGGGGGGHQFPGGRGGADEYYYNFPGGAAGGKVGQTNQSSKLFFGGSGGYGHKHDAPRGPGGNGGGIIYLTAASFTIGQEGRISANGGCGLGYGDTYGGGGGGAGGSILIGSPRIKGLISYALGATGGGGGGYGSNGADGTNMLGGNGGNNTSGHVGGLAVASNGGGGASETHHGGKGTQNAGGEGAPGGFEEAGGGGGGGGYITLFTNTDTTGITLYPAPYVEAASNAPTPVEPVSRDPLKPMIVTSLTPTLRWQFDNAAAGTLEKFYRVQILDETGGTVYWDSGKQPRADFIAVPSYANLQWDKLYRWQVKVWDNHDVEGIYAPEQYFLASRLPQILDMRPGNVNYRTPSTTNVTPRLTWQYSDPDANKQQRFQVIIYNLLTNSLTHDSGIIESDRTYYDIGSKILTVGSNYRWAVTVWDEKGLSSTSAFRFIVTNATPEMLTPISPTDHYRTSIRPVFICRIGDDLENDAQHFKLQIADDAGFTVNVKQFDTSVSTFGWELNNGTEWVDFPRSGSNAGFEGKLVRHVLQEDLAEGRSYYWRMAPVDATTGAANLWTMPRRFRVGSRMQFQLKNPIRTSDFASKLVLHAFYSLPQDGVKPASVKIEVCNNGLDAQPTWENATDVLQQGLYHRFTNRTKTADDWAVNVRYTIDSNDSIGPIEFDAFGFAFQ